MSIEVEVRARIGDLSNVKKALNELGAVFVKSENQADRIFGHAKFLDLEHKIAEGGLSARIREADGKARLEFKEIVREKGGIELNCIVSNAEMAEKMLKKLDFEEAFTIKKRRDIYSCQGLVVCLDAVEMLGNFIEIEKEVGLESEINAARKECADLLEKVAAGAQIEKRKYGDLMQEIINGK